MSFMQPHQWSLDTEIIVDNFAGGGGASTGIEMALGCPVTIAINHDANAVVMHKANHPHTEHLCEDVFAVDPKAVCKGRRVKLAWFSPDCTHHSKAKGGKPRSKKIRGLAWVVIDWAREVKPRIIMLENVEEWIDWGPLTEEGQPCKQRKGEIFEKWKAELESLGYTVEYRVLRACDYGTPTIRKRVFVIARCDGEPIVWPEPTHGKPGSPEVKSKKLKPWPVAADIIDWSLPCPSIFMDPVEAKKLRLKRPLKDNTMKRIHRGLQKFVFDAKEPFVVTVNHGGDRFRGQGVNDPFMTVTAARDGHGLVETKIERYRDFKCENCGEENGETWWPTCEWCDHEHSGAIDSHLTTDIAAPFIQHIQHASKANGTMPTDEPLRTITATPKGGGMALACAYMAQHNNTSADSRSAGVPVSSITTTGSQQGVVAAHITKFRNGATGCDMTEPLPTITSGGKMSRPGGANPLGVVVGHLERQFGKSTGNSATEPVGAVTAGGGGKTALCASHLVKLRGTCKDGQPVTEPAPTITAGGNHVGEVRAFLMKYYGTAVGQDCKEPLDTVTANDRFGLVMIKGELFQIVDIGMRMLSPRELYAAQGFPPDYKIGDRESDGFKFSKSQQVAKCGNSVCPPLAAALVRANVETNTIFAPMERSA
jgi:DNA (cytosine-5)-methyltransferase 1